MSANHCMYTKKVDHKGNQSRNNTLVLNQSLHHSHCSSHPIFTKKKQVTKEKHPLVFDRPKKAPSTSYSNVLPSSSFSSMWTAPICVCTTLKIIIIICLQRSSVICALSVSVGRTSACDPSDSHSNPIGVSSGQRMTRYVPVGSTRKVSVVLLSLSNIMFI